MWCALALPSQKPHGGLLCPQLTIVALDLLPESLWMSHRLQRLLKAAVWKRSSRGREVVPRAGPAVESDARAPFDRSTECALPQLSASAQGWHHPCLVQVSWRTARSRVDGVNVPIEKDLGSSSRPGWSISISSTRIDRPSPRSSSGAEVPPPGRGYPAPLVAQTASKNRSLW